MINRRPKRSIEEITEGMAFIPGGRFTMGSDNFYREEAPARAVQVDDFWIDRAPVTNREFAAFVDATGYRTIAEIAPDPRDYPGLLPGMDQPGSLLFQPTASPVAFLDPALWWTFGFHADWRHPTGSESDISDVLDHPVVHVAYADAKAYAEWAGKILPSEAEWEFAARGGLEAADYAWGDELQPNGAMLANYWVGDFPYRNERADGGYRTTPVGTYPANGYGLLDMIGNVWEWTADWYREGTPLAGKKSPCCAISNPRGGTLRDSIEGPIGPGKAIGRRVLKGGSHLCAESYCQRYRPAARHPQAVDSATSHIGFRCALRVDPKASAKGGNRRHGAA